MSGKSLARTLIAVLAGIALGGLVTLAARPPAELSPLPAPPTILAARGTPPAGIVAFEEQVKTSTGYATVGCGFLLRLPSGDAVGVTTAHSLGEGRFAPIAFQQAGRDSIVASFGQLYAPLGRPRTGADMTIDYVVMRPDAEPVAAFVLQPDPRGAPQPGERVTLYSGLGDGRGNPRLLPGTVESVDDNGAWIRMDEAFDPAGMSGSPILSQHTGQVVGMIIVMNWAGGRLRIGINPIGAILDAATG